jgi:hypothetical protein
MNNLFTGRKKFSLLNINWFLLFFRRPGLTEGDRRHSEQLLLLKLKACSLSTMLQAIQADYTIITLRVF